MRVTKVLILSLLFVIVGVGQAKLPTIKSNLEMVKVQDGDVLRHWKLEPDVSPDIARSVVPEGPSKKVTFITDVDSISFDVKLGKTYDFFIDWKGKKCHIQIVGVKVE